MKDDFDFFPNGIIWLVGVANVPKDPERDRPPNMVRVMERQMDAWELQMLGISNG